MASTRTPLVAMHSRVARSLYTVATHLRRVPATPDNEPAARVLEELVFTDHQVYHGTQWIEYYSALYCSNAASYIYNQLCSLNHYTSPNFKGLVPREALDLLEDPYQLLSDMETLLWTQGILFRYNQRYRHLEALVYNLRHYGRGDFDPSKAYRASVADLLWKNMALFPYGGTRVVRKAEKRTLEAERANERLVAASRRDPKLLQLKFDTLQKHVMRRGASLVPHPQKYLDFGRRRTNDL